MIDMILNTALWLAIIVGVFAVGGAVLGALVMLLAGKQRKNSHG